MMAAVNGFISLPNHHLPPPVSLSPSFPGPGSLGVDAMLFASLQSLASYRFSRSKPFLVASQQTGASKSLSSLEIQSLLSSFPRAAPLSPHVATLIYFHQPRRLVGFPTFASPSPSEAIVLASLPSVARAVSNCRKEPHDTPEPRTDDAGILNPRLSGFADIYSSCWRTSKLCSNNLHSVSAGAARWLYELGNGTARAPLFRRRSHQHRLAAIIDPISRPVYGSTRLLQAVSRFFPRGERHRSGTSPLRRQPGSADLGLYATAFKDFAPRRAARSLDFSSIARASRSLARCQSPGGPAHRSRQQRHHAHLMGFYRRRPTNAPSQESGFRLELHHFHPLCRVLTARPAQRINPPSDAPLFPDFAAGGERVAGLGRIASYTECDFPSRTLSNRDPELQNNTAQQSFRRHPQGRTKITPQPAEADSRMAPTRQNNPARNAPTKTSAPRRDVTTFLPSRGGFRKDAHTTLQAIFFSRCAGRLQSRTSNIRSSLILNPAPPRRTLQIIIKGVEAASNTAAV
uniref:Uncharacterized protein n=1 Tax=Mycena chlorophos TaxID=658473 RepID=A0ABQ0LQS0_MYCCL|nr:predicted protein [Mycena chlorophos]